MYLNDYLKCGIVCVRLNTYLWPKQEKLVKSETGIELSYNIRTYYNFILNNVDVQWTYYCTGAIRTKLFKKK